MAVDWRKVWTELPPEVEPLPAMIRGIYVESYRFANDDGVLAVLLRTAKPGDLKAAAEEVAHRLRARPSEAQAVVDAARVLFDVGALVLADRVIVIKDFVEEQNRTLTAAEQKERQRARRRTALVSPNADKVSGETGPQRTIPADTASDSADIVSDSPGQNVHDKTRQEETREDRSPDGAGDASAPALVRRARRRPVAPPAILGFEAFWAKYPRRVHRPEAERAFEKQIKSASDVVRLLASVERFAAEVAREGTEERFIAHPATYLNKRRWADEPASSAVDAPPAAQATAAAGGAPVATMPNGKPWPRDLARLLDGKPPDEQRATIARLRVAEAFRFESDGSARF